MKPVKDKVIAKLHVYDMSQYKRIVRWLRSAARELSKDHEQYSEKFIARLMENRWEKKG